KNLHLAPDPQRLAQQVLLSFPGYVVEHVIEHYRVEASGLERQFPAIRQLRERQPRLYIIQDVGPCHPALEMVGQHRAHDSIAATDIKNRLAWREPAIIALENAAGTVGNSEIHRSPRDNVPAPLLAYRRRRARKRTRAGEYK